MTSLTDFLFARVAEDEASARRGLSGFTDEGWHSVDCGTGLGYWANRSCECRYGARVLAECEAKRRIVEALIDAQTAVATYNTDDPNNNPPSYWQEWGNCHALRFAVESHAATYADHPDYREEWRP